jgi:hypothetical protein
MALNLFLASASIRSSRRFHVSVQVLDARVISPVPQKPPGVGQQHRILDLRLVSCTSCPGACIPFAAPLSLSFFSSSPFPAARSAPAEPPACRCCEIGLDVRMPREQRPPVLPD